MYKNVFLVSIFLCSFLVAQAKMSDFTKANSAFSKTYVDQDLNRRFSDKKNARFSTDKEFSTFKFVSSKDASRYLNMEANFGEADNAKVMEGMRNFNSEKNYRTPDYSQFKDTDRWYKEKNQIGFQNKDRDLSKKYLGKIDTDRRNQLNDKMRANYDDHFERSMSDINKFHFRSSHSTKSGIVVTKAGGDLEEDDSSIFDFLSNEQKIDSGGVKLILPKAMVTDPTKLERLSGNSIPVEAPTARTSSPIMNNASQQVPIPGTRRTIAEDTVDSDTMNFSTLGLPKEMQGGKTKIKIQVKD